VDVASRCGGNRGCKTVATAAQTYGAYVTDYGGVPVFYADRLVGRDVSWTGLLTAHDMDAFGPDDYEVMALPTPLTDNQR